MRTVITLPVPIGEPVTYPLPAGAQAVGAAWMSNGAHVVVQADDAAAGLEHLTFLSVPSGTALKPGDRYVGTAVHPTSFVPQHVLRRTGSPS